MAEGIDDVAGAFGREIAPQVAPRDQKGHPLSAGKPEPMFSTRSLEGDPLTGDTRDGGDDTRLRAREKEIADGDEQGDRGRRGRSTENAKNVEGSGSDEADDESADEEQGEPEERELQPVDEEGQVEEGDDEKYEVVVDGKPTEVTLGEMKRGYVRQATFHQWNAKLNERQHELESYDAQLRANWAWWDKARADYEADLAALIPPEPDWDKEFAANPAAAHENQKIYRELYGKLAQSRQARAQQEAANVAETDRRVKKYAVDGFSKFVMDHIKAMPDEPSLKKNVQSMRRTALTAGFNEYEVATVYDPRMLDILWKASKYDRMIAAKPKAVIPGKGRTLTPGAATPLSGNARRKGFDDAQRQLANSGKLEDAAEVFRRML